ncbi:MAG: alpha-glucosidase C-terminal domain-containing protein [Phycisphaerales bacterium]|nr:alpha-glucosidase C-terminal domain-containing protein [Phycisphaerales bacterium]
MRIQHPVSMTMGFLIAAAAVAAGWPPAPPLRSENSMLIDDLGTVPPTFQTVIRPATETRNIAGRYRLRFTITLKQPARSVALAGTFNNWNKFANPLAPTDEPGAWTGEIDLTPGMHQYKIVIDGERWIHDEANPEKTDDGNKGFNSVLRLGLLAHITESPAKIGDGKIELLGLEHDAQNTLYWQQLDEQRALVRYRTLAHDVRKVTLAFRDGATAELTPADEGPLFTLWETIVRAGCFSKVADKPEIEMSPCPYTFILEDGDLRATHPAELAYVPAHAHERAKRTPIFHTPDWAKNAVWYQIMLDRFRNGQPENDPDNARPWRSEWFTPSRWEETSGETFYKWFAFHRHYGGDIAGLESKLGYLKELGVNAIYLNPVFKADSHHKYDATNYVHIDDHFGTKGDYEPAAAKENLLDPTTWTWTETDKRFLAFVKTAKSMGFRVIIDGVFNHVGQPHPAFQDVKKTGKSSAYADWFEIVSWEPFKHAGWAGFDSLPAFRKTADGLASETAKQHIFNITRRWMDPNGDGDPSDGIDGWRLDVPNEIPLPFWAEWRDLVKRINPDAYISGEIWDRAEKWLDGRHFDAVMNYEFSRPLIAWIGGKSKKMSVVEFDRRLRSLRLAYPLEATLVMQNLVCSHDTDRVASMMHNPDLAYDQQNRVQDNNPAYDNSKPSAGAYAKARLALLVQMTYVGAPMIYYGDEVGMWGADDPTCRKPMLWEDLQPYDKPDENFVMREHLEYYRRAIALRNAHPALRTGSFRTLLADPKLDVWAFLRADDREQLVVCINASGADARVRVPLPEHAPRNWKSIWGDAQSANVRNGAIEIDVPKIGAVVLEAAP